MPVSKGKQLTGSGAVRTTGVVGVMDRDTNQVSAKVVTSTDMHSLSEHMKGDVRTNGTESVCPLLRGACKGTPQEFSPKHLDRQVSEFGGRHNVEERDTIQQVGAVRIRMEGNRLWYTQLIVDSALASGARA